jgi:large conductance mechanosensitive channel
MGLLSEFRAFAFKGNVIDMAVGIIIGAAFTSVVKSLVDDVVMPPIGKITGGVDFSRLRVVIQDAGAAADGAEIPEVAIKYGAFLNNIITFLIVGFCVFLLVKSLNAARERFEGKQDAAPAPPSPEVALLTEIRDALQNRG